MTTCDKKILQIEKTKRVEFLLEREFIEQHIAQGYPAKAIWKGLFAAGRTTMSYQMFMVHVRRHFPASELTTKAKIDRKAQSAAAPINEQMSVPKDEPIRLKSRGEPLPSFNISTIGKEHLLEPYKKENRNE